MHARVCVCIYGYAGTVIEVNVSELGLVTQTGKVVWGKEALDTLLLLFLLLLAFLLTEVPCSQRRPR